MHHALSFLSCRIAQTPILFWMLRHQAVIVFTATTLTVVNEVQRTALKLLTHLLDTRPGIIAIVGNLLEIVSDASCSSPSDLCALLHTGL